MRGPLPPLRGNKLNPLAGHDTSKLMSQARRIDGAWNLMPRMKRGRKKLLFEETRPASEKHERVKGMGKLVLGCTTEKRNSVGMGGAGDARNFNCPSAILNSEVGRITKQLSLREVIVRGVRQKEEGVVSGKDVDEKRHGVQTGKKIKQEGKTGPRCAAEKDQKMVPSRENWNKSGVKTERNQTVEVWDPS